MGVKYGEDGAMTVLNNVRNLVHKLGEDSTSWGALAMLSVSLLALLAIMMLFPYYG